MPDHNQEAESAAPCPLCESQQVQVCRDANNPAKDLARCRECKCTAPLSIWNQRRHPAVGEDGLPPLPAPVRMSSDQSYLGYTAEQYRQGQRDAVAADRRERDGAVINYGNPVDKSFVVSQDDLREELDELQNKYDMQNSKFWATSLKLQQAEEQIADLRAQLALKSQEGT